ncbi:hypothetical protein AUEXF2481DRAFT_25135 [Aureobasidium subglaciale EXF-2481]|uniref:F-box domain-containing protein n=1 Tax=Aureobasidium subglaciale (strain EXF-2481) TaxID=1043005 RepID=A0A074YSW3_AURSE|nr:uncharacterized protein AUEXF2481DRAFT_25135 [Aureobasidium subglaciale EXF-2481]KER00854.1 hypothetical protein AUEXF2481DRAFT_25135 [Aureobasidium subglaciale EXF-2481]
MGQLDSLPRELVYLILEYCQFDDCKNLRATCKYLSGLTNPRIFRTYRIAFFQSHLDRFVELSSKPEIARCIKRLVFVGDVIPQIDWVGTFEGLIDMREPWSSYSKNYIEERISEDTSRTESRLSSDDEYDYRMRILTERQDLRQAAYKEYDNMPKHTLGPEQVQYHFNQYQEYRQQQLDWGPNGLFLDALSRLPNLVSAENAKHGFADNHLHFPWSRIEKDIVINPNNWMQLHAVEVDDEEEVQVVDVLKYPIHMKHADCLLAAVKHRATTTNGSPLGNLRLVNVGGQPFLDMSEHYALPSEPNSSPIIHETRDTLPQRIIDDNIQGLSHLESLELDVSYCVPSTSRLTGVTQTWQTKQLFQEIHAILIAATKTLKVLKLHCRDDEGSWALEEHPMDAGDDTIGRLEIPTLPHLEFLRLSCTATERSLTNFLRTQSKTLRSLEIVDCDMSAGSWNSVLRQVPEIFEAGLQRIYLEGLHDEDYPRDSGDEALFEDGLDVGQGAHPHDRAILRYLLHGGEMPELDFNSWYERNRELADRGITEWEDELLDSEIP